MIRKASALLGLYLTLAYGSTVPKVSAPAGTFVGKTVDIAKGGQYNQFRGIPFAEAPIGDLRFKPTVPKAEKLEGEYNATEFKPFCLQINMIPNDFGDGQEDCLYLNVYTPATIEKDSGALKKVLVFLHGGGHVNGASDFYIPGEIVVVDDIIVVTANYRLGVLGFLTTLSDASRGNYGMWDQVAALQWVQDNIHAFGGDPAAVTVSGESAGAMDTSFLTLSPQGKGLFARAWSMSGTTGVDNHLTIANTDVIMEFPLLLARREKCLAEDAPAPESDSKWQGVVECLKQVPVERFANLEGLGAMPYTGPVIDGVILPKPVKEMFSDEAYLESIGFSDRDYMVSFCYNEGALFNYWVDLMNSKMTPEQLEQTPENAMVHGFISSLLANVHGAISPEVVAQIAKYYEENYEVNPLADYGSDAIFHIPGLEYIHAVTKAFGSKEPRVHIMRFVNFPEFLTGPYKGTLHGMDLMYVFDFYHDMEWLNKLIDYKIDGSKWNQADTDLKAKYQTLAASFVKTGKPSVTKSAADNELVDWPTFTIEGGHYLVFNENPKVEQHLKADRLEMFTKTIPDLIKEFPVQPKKEETKQHATDEL